MTALLEVDGLRVAVNGGAVVLDDLSFSVARGETLAIVGESGCGKSVTSLAIMRLLPPALRLTGGAIRFDGADLATVSPTRMRDLRGRRIGMIFQEPMTSLNPGLRVGEQIAEVLRIHEGLSRAAAWRRAVELLDHVRIPDPARRAMEYPHRLSGGQRQRVVIAAAIACRPDLIIADEPTTALDVTVQAQVLELLKSLQREIGSAVILITHNLGVVAQTADRVMVMYAGRKVEEGAVAAIFDDPRHPYTSGLLRATPDPTRPRPARGVLHEIPGMVPRLGARASGCAFRPRCARAVPRCAEGVPPLLATNSGLAACLFAQEGAAA